MYIDRNKRLFININIFYNYHNQSRKKYIYSLNNNNTIIPELDKIILKNKYELEKIVFESKNQNKIYYYIKITLDTNIPFFHLSRKWILINLLN